MAAPDTRKKDFFGTTFQQNILTRIFLKFSARRVLSPLEHIFNKVNRGIIQKLDEVWT